MMKGTKFRRAAALLMSLMILILGASAAAEVEPRIVGGGSFAYARDSQGVWYSWGDNQFGQMGRGNKTQNKNRIYEVMSKNEEMDVTQIREVYCGCDYSYFLMNDGRIFAVGNLSGGRLLNQGGILYTHRQVNIEDRTVVTMATGYGQALALNEAGEVYAWGRNNAGQVGNGTHFFPTEVQKLTELPKIKYIACGGFHSAAIDENGDLWMWGDNSYNQIHSGSRKEYIMTPMKMDLGGMKVRQVELGGHFSAIVDEEGNLYMWGRNDTKQVSIDTGKEKYVPERVKVDLPGPVKTLACYGSHTWCLLEDGSVWSWGCDGYGELGYGFRTPADTGLALSHGELEFSGREHKGPYSSKICDGGAVAVTLGDLYGIILMEDGTMLSAGMNKFGQLGRPAPYNGDSALGASELKLK